MTTHQRRWLIGGLMSVILIILFLYFLPWNWLRPFVSERLSSATGHEIHIQGDLDVHLSFKPRIIVHDVTIANAPWSNTSQMGKIGFLDVRINLFSLFHHRVELSNLKLVNADILLEQDASYRNNWDFKPDNKDTSSPWTLTINELWVNHSQVHFRNAEDTDLIAALSATDQSLPVTMIIDGNFQNLKSRMQLQGGQLLDLKNANQPYSLKAEGVIGGTEFSGEGTVTDVVNLTNLNLNLKIAGRSMAELYTILHVPLPPTPAYKISGQLTHENALWRISGFKGRVGGSDLAGSFEVDKNKTPQFIKADVVSNNLDLKDLSGFIGSRDQNGESAVEPAGKILPHNTFNLEKLRSANADVHFKGEHIVSNTSTFENLQAHMLIDNGRLTLDPLNFGIAGGHVVSVIVMNAQDPHITTHAYVTVERLQLQKLFPTLTIQKANVGFLSGRAKLVGRGNSVADMLGSSNGDIILLMDEGSVSKLILRLANLDIANTVVVLLTGDEQIPLYCMVADFGLTNGDMKVRAMEIDTEKQLITGEGDVYLNSEEPDLKITSKPTDNSLIALRGPILIKGTFANPSVRPELKKVVGRITLASVLGAVAGPLGLVPLVEAGKKKDSQCVRLTKEAKENLAKPVVIPNAH